MDKGNLLRRDSPRNQLIPDVVIHTECTVCFRCGLITEYQLCQLFLLSFLPVTIDFLHAGIDFTSRIIRQERIRKPLVKSQFPSVIGNLKHVIFSWVYLVVPYLFRPVSQFLHHIPL